MKDNYERVEALYNACWDADLELIKVLIKNVEPGSDNTICFRIACIHGAVDVVDFLTPYYYKLPEVEKFLLEDGFDIKPHVLSVVTALKERDMLANLESGKSSVIIKI